MNSEINTQNFYNEINFSIRMFITSVILFQLKLSRMKQSIEMIKLLFSF